MMGLSLLERITMVKVVGWAIEQYWTQTIETVTHLLYISIHNYFEWAITQWLRSKYRMSSLIWEYSLITLPCHFPCAANGLHVNPNYGVPLGLLKVLAWKEAWMHSSDDKKNAILVSMPLPELPMACIYKVEA